ncbi:hypothetical protein THASP1DRAFT_32420 [Thamnocephalis sphaerospora]|uniref:Fe2OG dioxygenase domain-containing protein n=1 Tax=Thamnocephalis sphaerospora TaxID=78915 RepID=A0A4P9XJ33_9FUNG|nr:hypothetical protein THASP1DRAFT_32420 [Thamnocephalis sphaerospora]|eukprot:RKP05742.1 hypothetical protein THASP1DRAFT_32420 [Thamnocephalis sphaerospora]
MTVSSLPVIDFGAYLSSDSSAEERKAVAYAIDKACSQHGIFYLVNHGVPQELCDKVRALGRNFFQLSMEEKRKYGADSLVRGYWSNSDTSQTNQTHVETIVFHPPVHCYDNGLSPDADPASASARLPTAPDALGEQGSWPSEEFRALTEEYTNHILQLNKHVVDSIADSLELADASRNRLQKAVSYVGFNGYNVLAQTGVGKGEISLAAHADTGCLTFLNQDSDSVSLQIQDRDGMWHGVPPIPGAFVVNVGSAFNRLTGGRYIDVQHRVVHCSEKSRVCVVVFVTPPFDGCIDPLPEFVTASEDSISHTPKLYGDLHLEHEDVYNEVEVVALSNPATSHV